MHQPGAAGVARVREGVGVAPEGHIRRAFPGMGQRGPDVVGFERHAAGLGPRPLAHRAVVLEIEAGACTVRWGWTGEAEYLIDSADRTLAEQVNQACKDALETDWERRTSEP